MRNRALNSAAAEGGRKRAQSSREELANSLSHGVGFVAAAVASPFLLVEVAHKGGPADLLGAAVFAATAMLTYLASTVYHAVPSPRTKGILRAFDRGSIFLLIAGTYTPFTLGVLRGGWGWILLGLVWSLAIAGVLMIAMGGGGARFRKVSMVLYLGMGWLIVIAIGPLLERMPPEGLAWLVAGGLAYTGGVLFYALDRIRYCHFIWHLFVLAGTACHFVAVMGYASVVTLQFPA